MSEIAPRDRCVLVIAPQATVAALIESALREAAFAVRVFSELTAEVRAAVRETRFAGAFVSVTGRKDLAALASLKRADETLPVACIGDAFLNAESIAAGAKSFLVTPLKSIDVQYEIARITGHEIRG